MKSSWKKKRGIGGNKIILVKINETDTFRVRQKNIDINIVGLYL